MTLLIAALITVMVAASALTLVFTFMVGYWYGKNFL